MERVILKIVDVKDLAVYYRTDPRIMGSNPRQYDWTMSSYLCQHGFLGDKSNKLVSLDLFVVRIKIEIYKKVNTNRYNIFTQYFIVKHFPKL